MDQVKKLVADEAALKAEFEIESSSWVEREKLLDDGYSVIEDMLDGEPFFVPLRLLSADCYRGAVF